MSNPSPSYSVPPPAFSGPPPPLSHGYYGHGAPPPAGRVGKTPGLKKNQPSGFFGAFLYIFAQKREFLGFFQFQKYFKVHPDLNYNHCY
jgi:hypothetical protein